jgi:hypothetical protein
MKRFNTTLAFQQVFLTVVCLTLLSGGTSLWLASKGNLSSQENRVFENCNTTWNMGIGAIFGLLGSKAMNLFQTGGNDNA